MKFFLLDGIHSKFYEATPENLRIKSRRKLFIFDFEINEDRIKQLMLDGFLINHVDYYPAFKELYDYLSTTRNPPKQKNIQYWIEDLETSTLDLEYLKIAK